MTKKPSKPKRPLPVRSRASNLLLRVARALDAAGQPFVVIGGQAVIRHGHVRFTRDVDVTVPVMPYEYPRIARIVEPLGISYRDVDAQADVAGIERFEGWLREALT